MIRSHIKQNKNTCFKYKITPLKSQSIFLLRLTRPLTRSFGGFYLLLYAIEKGETYTRFVSIHSLFFPFAPSFDILKMGNFTNTANLNAAIFKDLETKANGITRKSNRIYHVYRFLLVQFRHKQKLT